MIAASGIDRTPFYLPKYTPKNDPPSSGDRLKGYGVGAFWVLTWPFQLLIDRNNEAALKRAEQNGALASGGGIVPTVSGAGSGIGVAPVGVRGMPPSSQLPDNAQTIADVQSAE